MHTKFTPNDLDVLIHYYSSREPHERIHAPAVRESVRAFFAEGILEVVGRPQGDHVLVTYQVTERGEAWLKMILNTPYPERSWIDPRTKEVV